MNQQRYRSELRRAVHMRSEAKGTAKEYWTGYQLGLEKAFLGKKFKNDTLIQEITNNQNLKDKRLREKARGFEDGRKYFDSVKIGRPKLEGDMIKLPALNVERELKKKLEQKAKHLDISVAQCRRKALKAFTET